ncbi:hypothetical protein ABL78_6938 [Leptomonas seymouri]|uniref:Uncharacterized protein n=1 Tax=Leptomonas seymouri TaxID=5684 RepID=A0A0N1IIE5_LEPSE|nr:hypothetical protein ABL78_6938 [Leptomonas seymouri]|eukprot:KPI84013.1 hypothetical protein ABL78_6938 [Leptomonas seymouri]
MSDSDWEVLSTDGDGQLNSQKPSSKAAEAAAAELPAGTGNTAAESPPSRMPPTVDRSTLLEPLCLTINQTGTCLGVGHTKGYLVFRVSPIKTETAMTSTAAPESSQSSTEAALPAESRLTLDPQYNLDLLTFSHMRERMRQQKQRCASQAAAAAVAAAAAEPTRTSTKRESTASCSASREETDLNTARNVEGVKSESAAQTTKGYEEARLADRLSSPLPSLDDLGSFLTAAGRVFAQLKRDDALCESQAPLASRRQESYGHVSQKKPRAQALEESEALVDSYAVHHDPTTPNTEHLLHPPQAPLTPRSPVTSLGPRPVLGWSEEEDIEDIDAGEPWGTANDLPLRSLGNSEWARCRSDTRKGAAVRTARHNSETAENGEDDAEEETYVGFSGGGVAVMAFLYHQTWLALVGGGPTPMGPPNQVQFVRGGEPQHRLTMPHPVVKLFLDARLLFVVTTAELRVYSNPLEHNWVRLRQRVPMSASRASRYAAVTLAPVHAVNAGAVDAEHTTLRVWGPHESGAGPSLASTKNSSFACHSQGAPGASSEETEQRGAPAPAAPTAASKPPTTCVALPIIPVAVDYARSLLLLPVGDDCQGFALYRYATGPELAEHHETADTIRRAPAAGTTSTGSIADDRTATPEVVSGSAPTGRITAYLQHIATQQVAHKNALQNLVLYSGWPAATTRLLSTMDEPANKQQASAAAQRLSDLDGGRGGAVTLVAASSEYATRLTLWMLTRDGRYHQQQQRSTSSASRLDPQSGGLAHTASSGSIDASSSAEEACFVLLREFRVGLRLTAAKAVMAALPSVSRFMPRAHPSTIATPQVGTIHKWMSSDASQCSSNVSFANTSRKGGHGRSAFSEGEGNGAMLTTSAGSYGLPPDATSSSTYRGTVVSWASEAASAVAACASISPTVQHLQFIGNGAYLLCVHGSDAISVFSTSAPESEQEAKDVTRDRAVAEHNRYSRLSAMKEYLPRALSNRLDAYTRQAWSSCSGHLPAFDIAFVPRWLYLKHQDAAAAARLAPQLKNVEAPSSTATAAQQPNPGVPSSASAPPQRPASGGTTTSTNNAAGRRFFQRLTALVGARPQPPQRLPAPLDDTAAAITAVQPALSVGVAGAQGPRGTSPAGIPSTTESTFAMHDPSPGRHSRIPHRGTSPVGTVGEKPAPLSWGTPFTELSQCVCVWPAPRSSDAGRNDQFLGSARRPTVLNCATCEGAFANVFLFAEEGEVVTSRVVPYAAPCD